MRIRSSGEEGVAMVIALLVSMVLLILSSVIVAQSIRQRAVEWLQPAKADIGGGGRVRGNYYALLQSTPVVALSCNPVTQPIASAPAAASFTAIRPSTMRACYPPSNVLPLH